MSTAKAQIELSAAAGVGRRLAAVLRGQRAGGGDRPATGKVRRRDLTFILRNLSTLIANGVPLPKAIATLIAERSMRRYAAMLEDLRRRVEAGETFSSALAEYPRAFSEVMVCQVRAGERAGVIAATLARMARQTENANRTRSLVIRRLSYPAVLAAAGTAAVTFMLVFVIPVFQQIYAETHVPLPLITRVLMAVGQWMVAYGWIVLLLLAGGLLAFRRARKRPGTAVAIDRALLRVPLIGDWLRNLAVMQFMDVFGDLMESGFRVVEALDVSVGSVGNRALRQSVEQLRSAVTRGERFGRELDQLRGLFPPVVGQLIAIGEQTGNLAEATANIREHLRDEIRRQTNILVGVIEPVLTILLAATIAAILLAVYLPMFDMIGAVGKM